MLALPPTLRTASAPHLGGHEDFAALLAEQLRRAPWLLVSALTHAALLLLLLLLLPAAPRAVAITPVQIAAVPDVVPLPPPPPPPPLLQPELLVADVTTINDPVASEDAPLDSLDAFVDPAPPGSDAAFDAPFVNATIGVGGGAGSSGHGLHGQRGRRRSTALLPQIDRALNWLARHQDDDGHWDADDFMKHDRDGLPCDGAGNGVHDVGVTGLAMLAFLGDGSTLRAGPFRDALHRGVRWLRTQQADNGRFGAAAAADFVYDHAIAAYAMAEACGLSDYRLLREPAERGLAYLAAHRNPYGAWRYQPRDGDADVSVTGWCLLALASGKSLGLAVDDGALRDGLHFLDACTTPDGRCGYTRPGELSSRRPGDHAARFPPERGEALTAVALFCRYFLGQQPTVEPRMRAAAQLLALKPPRWDPASGAIDHYYWYYGTYAMYQAGGSAWQAWSKQLDAAVVRTQRADGNFAGSWDPAGAWGEDGGRVYATAILALCLEAHFRYTRLVR